MNCIVPRRQARQPDVAPGSAQLKDHQYVMIDEAHHCAGGHRRREDGRLHSASGASAPRAGGGGTGRKQVKAVLPPPRTLYSSFEQAGMRKVHHPHMDTWQSWPCFEEALALSRKSRREFAQARLNWAISREQELIKMSESCCPPGEVEEWCDGDPDRLKRLKEYYHQSFLAASTSAHAQYPQLLESGVEPTLPSALRTSALSDLT